MKYTTSTYQILAYKALNRDIDELWIDWAIEMMESGYATEHLAILAGLSVNFMNQFYAQDLTSRALHELSLDYSNQEQAVKQYAVSLIDEMLVGRKGVADVLKELGTICEELDFENYLYDFYLLQLAYKDLHCGGYQFYWPGATQDNIDGIIIGYFQTWAEKYRDV
jgi:hypothetical protein